MTEQQLEALGPALDDFLQPYLFCCGYTQSFAHLHTYCKGLLSDLKRKTVEPIALASGWRKCRSRLGFERTATRRWRTRARSGSA